MDMQKIGISEPCDVDWSEMTGVEVCKFCRTCDKSVYNFSAMTVVQAQKVLQKEEDPCVRFRRNNKGEIHFRSEAPRRRSWGRGFARTAVGLAFVSLTTACGTGSGDGLVSRTLNSVGEALGFVDSGRPNSSGEEMGEDVELPIISDNGVQEREFTMGEADNHATGDLKPVPFMGKVRVDHD